MQPGTKARAFHFIKSHISPRVHCRQPLPKFVHPLLHPPVKRIVVTGQRNTLWRRKKILNMCVILVYIILVRAALFISRSVWQSAQPVSPLDGSPPLRCFRLVAVLNLWNPADDESPRYYSSYRLVFTTQVTNANGSSRIGIPPSMAHFTDTSQIL